MRRWAHTFRTDGFFSSTLFLKKKSEKSISWRPLALIRFSTEPAVGGTRDIRSSSRSAVGSHRIAYKKKKERTYKRKTWKGNLLFLVDEELRRSGLTAWPTSRVTTQSTRAKTAARLMNIRRPSVRVVFMTNSWRSPTVDLSRLVRVREKVEKVLRSKNQALATLMNGPNSWDESVKVDGQVLIPYVMPSFRNRTVGGYESADLQRPDDTQKRLISTGNHPREARTKRFFSLLLGVLRASSFGM